MDEYNDLNISKYSKKIINFFDNNTDINFDLKLNEKINYDNHQIIIYLQKLIKSTYKLQYEYKMETSDVLKIHDQNEYPLMYIFFIKLNQTNLYNVPEINNFYEFTKWYKRNQHSINLNSIKSKIETYVKSETNKDDMLLQIYDLMYNHKGHRSNLHKILYENHFMPLDVQHYVESIDMKKCVITSNDYLLTIYNPDDNVLDTEFINRIIHIIYVMIGIAKNASSHKTTLNKPDITLILTSQKKLINEMYDDGVLSAYNINSGASIPTVNVIIWRKEEIYKVLIHELIHFFEFDFHLFHEGYNKLKKNITETYNISDIDCPNESYTECFATVIHSVFTAEKLNLRFSKIFRYELLFTLFQVSKCLSFFGITNVDQLGYKKIRQTTSVFSYFVIKSMLIFNLNKVFDFIRNDIKNIKITDKIPEFNILIKNCATDEYFDTLQLFLNKYHNNKNSNKNDFVNKTMRMTCFQL